MNILVTGGDGRLARAFAAALPAGTTARLADTAFSRPLPPGVEAACGDVREPEFAQTAVSGMNAVIHLEPLSLPGVDDLAAIDRATRGTFVLMNAALDAGIERIITGSSLALFDALPVAWNVNEEWRPYPQPVLEHLCPWLAELSTRQTTWAAAAPVICLRFGGSWTQTDRNACPMTPHGYTSTMPCLACSALYSTRRVSGRSFTSRPQASMPGATG